MGRLSHHRAVTRRWGWLSGFLLLILGVGAGLLDATPATAASCGAITIAEGQGLTLDVSSVLVYTGGCVRFANLTSVTVTVKVSGSSFSARLPARTPASASPTYVATDGATVTASDGLRTGRGTISVEAPPPTPKASTTYVPPPVESLAPTPPTHSPSAPPSPSSSPSATPSPTHSNSAVASLPSLPSLPTGGEAAPPAANHPVVAPQVHPTGSGQLAAPVVESTGAASRGLPAAVAAVVVIGLATAFGRAVLAASPAVDRRGRYVRPSL